MQTCYLLQPHTSANHPPTRVNVTVNEALRYLATSIKDEKTLHKYQIKINYLSFEQTTLNKSRFHLRINWIGLWPAKQIGFVEDVTRLYMQNTAISLIISYTIEVRHNIPPATSVQVEVVPRVQTSCRNNEYKVYCQPHLPYSFTAANNNDTSLPT